MNSSNNQKTTLHALNAHLITALLSLFIAGILMIFLGLFFGLEALRTASHADLYQSLVVTIIIFGLILIAFGVMQSLGIINKIKRVIDHVLKKGDVGIRRTQEAPSTPGIGSGLKIIRPRMSESEPKPIVKERTTPKPAASQKRH